MGKGNVRVAFHVDKDFYEAWSRAAKTVNMSSAEDLLRVVVAHYGYEWLDGEADVVGALGLNERESYTPTWALEMLSGISGKVGEDFEEKYKMQKAMKG